MTEKTFQSQVKKYLESKGAYVVNYVAQAGYSIVGVPDLLVCVQGLFFGIELKMGNGHKTSPLQQAHINKIIKANGIGFVFTWSKDWRDRLWTQIEGLVLAWVTK